MIKKNTLRRQRVERGNKRKDRVRQRDGESAKWEERGSSKRKGQQVKKAGEK